MFNMFQPKQLIFFAISHKRLGLIKEPEKFVEVEEIAYRGLQMSHHVSPRTQSMLRMHCFHTQNKVGDPGAMPCLEAS